MRDFDILAAVDAIKAARVLVVGDAMLDRYVIGNVNRISPEAPVGVLSADEYQVRPGGAAGVAVFATALRSRVSLAAFVGKDTDGTTLENLCRDAGVDTSLLLVSEDRMTTRKERFIGRASQRHTYQMLRVDHENTAPLCSDDEARMEKLLATRITESDVVLISDYAKGVCTERLIRVVISTANQHNIPVIVDPGRGRSVEIYRDATVLKPNRSEAAEITGIRIHGIDAARSAAQHIAEQSHVPHIVMTLDKDGCIVAGRPAGRCELPLGSALVGRSETGGDCPCDCEKSATEAGRPASQCELPLGNASDGRSEEEGDWQESAWHHIPAESREAYDICGAGDMFLAMLGVSAANGHDIRTSAELANIAAGLEVDRLGTFPVPLHEIRAAVAGQADDTVGRDISLSDLLQLLPGYRQAGQRIVFTNGCFDLLHRGHIHCLQEAAAMGDVLVVGLNSDDSIRKLKGPDRPVIGQQQRAAMLDALGCVDHVLIFSDPTPHALLHAIRPDVLVKSSAYAKHQCVGHEIVEAYGGQVAVTSHLDGISTTLLLNSIKGDQ